MPDLIAALANVLDDVIGNNNFEGFVLKWQRTVVFERTELHLRVGGKLPRAIDAEDLPARADNPLQVFCDETAAGTHVEHMAPLERKPLGEDRDNFMTLDDAGLAIQD
jgi:hypothetical protein